MILELTVEFETNILKNGKRKLENYKDLVKRLEEKYDVNWFWTFKRNSIELITLNPTKFEQIRKFKNFRMKKKNVKKRA